MSAVDLYWLPLGAGGHSVRLNGRAYEALVARRAHRRPMALYHSALEVHLPEGTYAIEMTPAWAGDGQDRGVVAEGAVGSRRAGRLRLFRYEVRCWLGGRIPDLGEAVGGAQRLTTDEDTCRRIVQLLPCVPTPVWGRDELGTGDMWNSNSVVAWVLSLSGIDVAAVAPPRGGRAPGWSAGVASAERHQAAVPSPQALEQLERLRGSR